MLKRARSSLTISDSPPQRRADMLGRSEKILIYAILAIASLAYNYNFVLVDFIRPYLVAQAKMSLVYTAWLYTAQGLGVICGSFSMPIIISRLHAKPVLVASASVLGILTFSDAVIDNFNFWLVSRFLVGIMLAGCYISATTMLANLFPPNIRGRLLSVNAAMFSIALLAIGALGAVFGGSNWRTLIWVGAAAPALVAVAVALFLPSDKHLIVYADADTATELDERVGRWSDMLGHPRIWLTLGCLVIAGLNFSAYQFYSGFITTYLVTVRHFSSALTGMFVIVDGVGTLVGSFVWGWVSDRWGRRVNAVGLALSAAFIMVFLAAPVSTPVLAAVEFGYAFCLSCTYIWAAYFAELFPVRLRPMGTALLHGGHIISLFAPLLITTVATHASLAVGMALAPASFTVCALIWWSLPETLRSGWRYRGFNADLRQIPHPNV